jgi:hypothetical protein
VQCLCGLTEGLPTFTTIVVTGKRVSDGLMHTSSATIVLQSNAGCQAVAAGPAGGSISVSWNKTQCNGQVVAPNPCFGSSSGVQGFIEDLPDPDYLFSYQSAELLSDWFAVTVCVPCTFRVRWFGTVP